MIALTAYSPASSPDFMSVTPGPKAVPAIDAERALGRGPGVEHGVHVPDEQDPRPAGLAMERADDRVPEASPGSGRMSISAPRSDRKLAVQRPTSLTPSGVYEPQSMLTSWARSSRYDDRSAAIAARSDSSSRSAVVSLVIDGQSTRPMGCYPAGTVRLVEIRLLEGPNVYRLEPVVKLEVALGRRRTWYGQRDPGRHALVRLGRRGAAARLARPDRRDRGLDPPAAGRPRRGPDRARRPSLIGSGPLDRHLPVDRRGSGADPDRGGRRARRAGRLAVADRPADRGPGATHDPLDGAHRGRPDDAAALDPRRRPTDPERSRSRGRTASRTVTRLITHILVLAGRHVGTTTSDGVLVDERMVEPGDWTGPGGAQQILARSDIEVAVLETARGGIVLRGMGYESNDASILTNVSSDHLDLQGIHTLPELAEVKATVCRITKPDGWVVLNGDDPLVASVARRVRAQRRLLLAHLGRDRVRASSRRHVGRGGRAYLVRDGWMTEVEGTRATRIAEVARIPIAIGGLARHNVANAMAAAGGARGLGATIEQVRDGLLDFRPSAERSPGRLNLFRLGSRLVIVDFAHNEAGISAVLDVAEGIAGGAAGRTAPITAIIGTAGDRPDDTLRGIGRIAAQRAQRVAIKETRKYLRGRTEASVIGELLAGVKAGGGVVGRRADLRERDRRAPGRGQRPGPRRAAGHRADVPRGPRRRVRPAQGARRAARRRHGRADQGRAAAPGATAPRLSGAQSGRGHQPRTSRRRANSRRGGTVRQRQAVGGSQGLDPELGLGRLERPRRVPDLRPEDPTLAISGEQPHPVGEPGVQRPGHGGLDRAGRSVADVELGGRGRVGPCAETGTRSRRRRSWPTSRPGSTAGGRTSGRLRPSSRLAASRLRNQTPGRSWCRT